MSINYDVNIIVGIVIEPEKTINRNEKTVTKYHVDTGKPYQKKQEDITVTFKVLDKELSEQEWYDYNESLMCSGPYYSAVNGVIVIGKTVKDIKWNTPLFLILDEYKDTFDEVRAKLVSMGLPTDNIGLIVFPTLG